MKAITLAAPGGLDKLRLDERPDPGVPGPGAIRVRLHASSKIVLEFRRRYSARSARSSRWTMAARPGWPRTASISRELRPMSRAAWAAS